MTIEMEPGGASPEDDPSPARPIRRGRSRGHFYLAAAEGFLRLIARGDMRHVRATLSDIRTPRPTIWRIRFSYFRRFRISLRRWIVLHQRFIAFDKCTWMGVRALKNPLDAWIYQEIIYEVRPEVIVEIGSATGGSTLYLAHLLDILGDGCVVSVDISREHFIAQHSRILEVTGDSSSSAVIEQVRHICAGKRALVIHDGDHRRTAVRRDLDAYAPLVTVGSYLIVEDGIVDLFGRSRMGGWYDGPLVATEEFVRENQSFVIDRERERYLITYNPRGFLRRIS